MATRSAVPAPATERAAVDGRDDTRHDDTTDGLPHLLTAAEVATALRYTPQHVLRLGHRYLSGKGDGIPCIRTPGGRLRFRSDDIARLMGGAA